jgi:hypothetical protein
VFRIPQQVPVEEAIRCTGLRKKRDGDLCMAERKKPKKYIIAAQSIDYKKGYGYPLNLKGADIINKKEGSNIVSQSRLMP